MIKKVIYISYLVITVGIISCESEKRPMDVVGDIPEVMSFSDDIQPIFDGTSRNIELSGKGRACTDCHDGKTPPNLTESNAHIELIGGGHIDTDNPESSKLYETMAFGTMNKYTNLTDTEYVLEWIKQGAEDN